MNRIIITAKTHPVLEQTLVKKGYDVLYLPLITPIELIEIIHTAIGVVVATNIGINRDLIDRGTKLQWIARLGSGMDHIDTEYATSKNIRCLSSPEGNRDAVAEHALGMLLNIMNNISRAQRQTMDGKWIREDNRGTELKGKTVGIIGYGNTGSAFAGLLSSFGVNILAYDKYKLGFGNNIVKEVGFDELCSRADVISLHVPLNNETLKMADSSFFSSLSQQPYFINTSRGKVADSGAILDALETSKIRGACIDVIENEDLASHTEVERALFYRLCQHPRVILTPHIAGYSEQSYYKVSWYILEKLGLA